VANKYFKRYFIARRIGTPNAIFTPPLPPPTVAGDRGTRAVPAASPPSFPDPAVPRPSQRTPLRPQRHASSAVCPDRAKLRHALLRAALSVLPPRAGGAAGAAREPRPLARGSGMPRGCFQGCAREKMPFVCPIHELIAG
jgi:hypothetical protein